MICPAPNRWWRSRSSRNTVESSFCAATVPSHDSGGARQVSQLPHGRRRLAEVGEQLHAAALDRLAQREHRVEVLREPASVVPVAGRVVDHLALLHDVGEAVGEPGGGGQAVAARPAGLLVVALDRLGQVEVGDEPDVGLVDAHAEGDRRDHDDAVLAQEARLVRGAGRAVEPGVVRQRR